MSYANATFTAPFSLVLEHCSDGEVHDLEFDGDTEVTINPAARGATFTVAGLTIDGIYSHDVEFIAQAEITRRLAELAASDEVGMSFGPRRVHVAVDSHNTDRAHIFAFGAYADTYVLVFGDGGSYDALEAAAGVLADVAPGCFSEPDYDAAREELGAEENDDTVREHAETDLTYTESGYLASCEWTIVGEDMSFDEIIAFAKNEV